jgi:hypothetical protein
MKFATVLAAVMLLAAAPAFADCASELKSAEMAVMKVTDMKTKEMAIKDLDMAKKAMMDKKEADCIKASKMAHDAAMMKGGMKK